MKKIFWIGIPGLMIVFSLNTGCKKSNHTPEKQPSVRDFAIQSVLPFTYNTPATIVILAPHLAKGKYTVRFDLVGGYTWANNTATLIMNGPTGTFQTPAINTNENVAIIINSITDTAGDSAIITNNNVKNFNDSTGLMTCKINGVTYHATNVLATLTGTTLVVAAAVTEPAGFLQIANYNYSNNIGTIVFSPDDPNFIGAGSYFDLNGSKDPHDGTITITSTSPILAGTFSFNTADGTHFTSGIFSCSAP